MDTASLAERYRELDDDALLRVAADRKDLTPEATMALDSELAARRLGQIQINQVVASDQLFDKRQARQKMLRQTGSSLYGFCGRWHVQRRLGAEIYTATKFVKISYLFPVIPLGTYLLIRPRNYRRFLVDPRVVRKLPMDWQQVLWIWCRSLLILLAIGLLIRFLIVR